jgi:hypothetical protein
MKIIEYIFKLFKFLKWLKIKILKLIVSLELLRLYLTLNEIEKVVGGWTGGSKSLSMDCLQ